MHRKTTSFSLWDAQVDLLVFAATRHDMNVSEYFREYVIPMVAKECGKSAPEVPKTSSRVSSFPPAAANGIDYDLLVSKIVDRIGEPVADNVMARMTAMVKRK